MIQFAPFGWVILLVGLAGGLGSAAIVSADDALTAFFLTVAAAILTLIEVIVPG